MKRLAYNEPIEHVTMDLCILGGLQEWGATMIEKSHKKIQRQRGLMDRPGMPVHPATVLRAALGGHVWRVVRRLLKTCVCVCR